METKPTAPYKRGTKLTYTCPTHKTVMPVKYVKWHGLERAALIVVEDVNKERFTVNVADVSTADVETAMRLLGDRGK